MTMKKAIATPPGKPTIHINMKPDEIAVRQVEEKKYNDRLIKEAADREKDKTEKQNKKSIAEQRIKTKFGWNDKDLEDLKEILS